MPDVMITFRIAAIVAETAEAASFILEPVNRPDLSYVPGQFLTLIFNRNGHDVRRSYSIASTPGIDKLICITVKRIHNGEISRLLLDYYKAGDTLYGIAPTGMFVLPKTIDEHHTVFLMTAGSGITPVFSLLQQLLHQTKVPRVILLYQNHSVSSTIFRKQLEQLAQQFEERFIWLDFISTAPTQQKKITNDYLELLVNEYVIHPEHRALFFICGPTSFMRMCQFTLRLAGVAEPDIRKEYFVIDIPPAPPLIKDAQPRRVLIKSASGSQEFVSAYPATILQSALDNKIQLPYSCKGGRCSACAARCIKGEVLMSMNDVLTDADLTTGLVLTCVGYALTDIELEY